MIWRVGTSGFSYKEWVGSFYPEKTRAADMLAWYSGQLPAVEINNTFYRNPKTEVMEAWANEVQDDFRFAVKANRRITHIRRLKEATDETAFFLSRIAPLGNKLGLILFQLPPNQKVDVERLRSFLDLLPVGTRAAFEFRHPTWAEDAVVDTLRERGFALCFVDGDEEGAEGPADPNAAVGAAGIPFEATTSYGYLRLRRASYTDDDLKAFADRCKNAGWSETFVFLKHEDEGAGPAAARRFLELLGTD